MKYRLLDFLQCPHCKDNLELHVFKKDKVSYDNTEDLREDKACPSGCKNPDPNKKNTAGYGALQNML